MRFSKEATFTQEQLERINAKRDRVVGTLKACVDQPALLEAIIEGFGINDDMYLPLLNIDQFDAAFAKARGVEADQARPAQLDYQQACATVDVRVKELMDETTLDYSAAKLAVLARDEKLAEVYTAGPSASAAEVSPGATEGSDAGKRTTFTQGKQQSFTAEEAGVEIDKRAQELVVGGLTYSAARDMVLRQDTELAEIYLGPIDRRPGMHH